MLKDIIIPNKEEFEKKKQKFTKDNFHVIADFDATLTKAFLNGKKSHSSFSWIRDQEHLDPEYTKKAYALFYKYYPIEIDPHISSKEKDKKMLEWWKAHLKLFVDYKLDKNMIDKINKENKIGLRDKGDEFIELLKKNNIPLLIFSAGIGDVIKGFLEFKNILHKNMHIISNFFKFDSKEKVVDYNSKIIHTFNKNEYAIKDSLYHKSIEKRKNVILLGDGLGDANMAEGLKHDSIIKISFYNHKEDKLLDKFKESFDVIILNDGPMNFVNNLIKDIIDQ